MRSRELVNTAVSQAVSTVKQATKRRRIGQHVLERIKANVARIAEAGRDAIDQRLQQLDREWHLERTLNVTAASFSLAGLALGHAVNRRFYAIPATMAGFLLEHAIHGWCPPVPVLRRLGVRTPEEIEIERQALKVLRGDFKKARPLRRLSERHVKRAVRRAWAAAHV